MRTKKFDEGLVDYEKIQDAIDTAMSVAVKLEGLIPDATDLTLRKTLSRLRSSSLTLVNKINSAFYEDDSYDITID